MFERICHVDKELEESMFLFGARQTGKSPTSQELKQKNTYDL